MLSCHSCNQAAGDRIPSKVLEGPEWDAALSRVIACNDDALLAKFTMTEEQVEEFTKRHLADTRYISKLAAQYVEKLYGGRDASVPWEDRNRRCVYVSSGVLTAKLRKRWGLNGVLKDTYGSQDKEKVRTDHRHHAVDAIVIAVTTERMVQQASWDAQRLPKEPGYFEPRYFSPPWPRVGDIKDQVMAFRREVRDAIEKITVSHRVDHKLKGKLHEDTYYSPKVDGQRFVYLRVPVFELKAEDIDDPNNKIDSYIRTALRKHHLHLGGEMKKGADLKKFEKNPAYIEKNGRKIFIRKVLKAVPASSVARLERREGQPSIKLGENHHFVIFERTSEDGKPMWYTPGPVSRFEVMKKKDRAKREGISQPYPLIETKDGPGSTYKMFLMKGDAVRMRDPVNDLDDTYIFASSSEGDYAFLRHSTSVPSPKSLGLTQGAMRQQMQARGDRIRIRNIDKLRELKCRKIMLDPLGRFSNRSE
jgi:CRISPR-associated endonuclease Csn1